MHIPEAKTGDLHSEFVTAVWNGCRSFYNCSNAHEWGNARCLLEIHKLVIPGEYRNPTEHIRCQKISWCCSTVYTSSAQVNVRLAWEYQFKIIQDCSPKALSESLWEFGARHLSDRLAECTTVKSADEEECRAGCNNHTAVGFQQFAHVGVIIWGFG